MISCGDDDTCNCITAPDSRYSEELFSEVEVTSVQYDVQNDLWMDVYTPKGDAETARRVVLMAHGGAFVYGDRQNPLMVDYATRLAKYGYVAISYEYRLASGVPDMLDSVASLSVVAKALADGKTVLDLVIASQTNGNPYGIDATKIALAGNSAGAVMSLHMGYMDEGDVISANLQAAIDSAGGWTQMTNPSGETAVKAIVSLAGGIVNTNWLDVDGPSLIMAHGTWDNIVPYGCGHVLNNSPTAMILCGSQPLAASADAVGLNNQSIIFPELLHCPWNDDSALADQVFNFIVPELKAAMD